MKKTVAILAAVMVAMATVAQDATPVNDNPVIVPAPEGVTGAGVDVWALRDASKKDGGVWAHIKRNKWRYTGGLAAAIVTDRVAKHNDWLYYSGGDKSGSGATGTQQAGASATAPQILVAAGDNSPVIINFYSGNTEAVE